MTTYDALSKRITDGAAVTAVIGLGYVGLPRAQLLCRAGYHVLGFDVDTEKIARLQRGESYIAHIDSSWIADAVASGTFTPTPEFQRLATADCISICVPTPLNQNREPDIRFVRNAAETVARHLRPGQLILLESTTYPGTTTEILLPIFEDRGLRAGEDFFLAFSPEREDPGNIRFSSGDVPKIVGGVTPRCTELARIYCGKLFADIVPVSNPETAELAKLLENIFRSVNIALVNELKILCGRMNLDVWEVIEAAATKPFGFMPFYPGPGLGGHCIPVDPFYLSWKAREYGFNTRFIELSGEINTHMPQYVVERIFEALNERGKTIKNARLLLLGAAYKKNVDDLRESPALALIERLRALGAHVAYNDPHIPSIPPGRHCPLEMHSTPLTEETLAASDCVLICTAHSAYDYPFIVEHSPLVVDTRNATRDVSAHRERIVKA